MEVLVETFRFFAFVIFFVTIIVLGCLCYSTIHKDIYKQFQDPQPVVQNANC
jgi:hypothetical protein